MQGVPARACVAVAAVFFAGVAPAAAAPERQAPPPADFFGVVPQAPLAANDLASMEGVVGTLRIPVYWSECEPAPGEYDFTALDRQVGAAAAHGIRLQPFVFGTPAWLAAEPARPPLGPRARGAWVAFLRVLVHRYGTGGGFWHGRLQRRPIRLWQVWNEPNFVLFWRPWPNPSAYARLLRISAATIRRADRRARVVLAGVAPVGAGIGVGAFLRKLFRVAGVRRDFDVAAIHPYSATLRGVEYRLRAARRALAGAGLGRRPLLVTEVGVASWGDYPSAFVRGRDGQAEFLRATYARLLQMRRRWRIAGVDWFTWRDTSRLDSHCAFCQGAGLLDRAGRPKPAWWALRRLVKARSG
jgi:polysaccharide biosynthesis protein PslG